MSGITAVLSCLLISPIVRVVEAQPVAVPDHASRSCLDVQWLDPDAICSGRVRNATGLALLGGSAGALAGFVGGAVVPAACIGNGEAAAVRGAIAGAAMASVGTLLARHVTRRTLDERDAAARERASAQDVQPWSWRDIRPAIIVTGVVASGGAAIGALQGSRRAALCDGVAGGALRGAGIYGAGTLATIGGSMIAVRVLF